MSTARVSANKAIYLSTILASSLAYSSPVYADENDSNCEILFCMVAGFATPECIPAYDRMIKNILPFPVKPPFGTCSFTNELGQNEAIDETSPDFAYLSKIRIYWWDQSEHEVTDASGNASDTNYSYNLRECDADNENCKNIYHGVDLSRPGIGDVTSGSGTIDLGSTPPMIGRYMSMAYPDHEGTVTITEWSKY